MYVAANTTAPARIRATPVIASAEKRLPIRVASSRVPARCSASQKHGSPPSQSAAPSSCATGVGQDRGRDDRNDRRQRSSADDAPASSEDATEAALLHIARKRSCDECGESHAAQQDRLRYEIEAAQDNAEKAEDFEQCAQR